MLNKKMDCKKVCALLTAYLDEEVTPSERAYIEKHLDDCPKCRKEYEALSATRQSLRNALKSTAEGLSPRPDAWKRVREKISGDKGQSAFRFGSLFPKLAMAAAGVFIIAIAVFVWQFARFGGADPLEKSFTGNLPSQNAVTSTTTTIAGMTKPATAGTAPDKAATSMAAPAPTTTRIPTTTRPPAKYIAVKAAFDKQEYLPGEAVNAVVSFSNVAGMPRDIEPYPPVVEVHAGTGSVVNTIPVSPGTSNLKPGETTDSTITWNQDDANGNLVPYGRYSFNISNQQTPEDAGSLGSVYILPPEGVIEKTIAVNDTETVGDISVTLEKVELTAAGIRFYVFSDDIASPVYGGNVPPVYAEYSLDNAPVRERYDKTVMEWASNSDRVNYRWIMFIPVPAGTHELTFRIDGFSGNDGPWEFKVNLD